MVGLTEPVSCLVVTGKYQVLLVFMCFTTYDTSGRTQSSSFLGFIPLFCYHTFLSSLSLHFIFNKIFTSDSIFLTATFICVTYYRIYFISYFFLFSKSIFHTCSVTFLMFSFIVLHLILLLHKYIIFRGSSFVFGVLSYYTF